MTKSTCFGLLTFLFCTSNYCWADTVNQVEQSGKKPINLYTMNQTPPGTSPMVFAPGTISRNKNEFNASFSPDGTMFCYSVADRGSESIWFVEKKDDKWTRPEVLPFSGKYKDADPIFSSDGLKLYFISKRPLDNSGPAKDWDIWFVDRKGRNWSEPKNLGPPVNSPHDEWYVSFTLKGTLYFASNRPGSMGNHDIYRSSLVNGKYTKPENLGPRINSKYIEQDPFIAPDESYLLFTSVNRPDSYGSGDIYISRREPDGSWTKAQNLGEKINTSTFDFCPIISPDGQYFFYASKEDIYWVDAVSALTKTSRGR